LGGLVVVALDDDDPLWGMHSGGEGHRGAEWGDGGGALAETFYAILPGHTKFVFDLLMDHPGERLTSDWIAGQMPRRRADGARAASRRSVSTSLSPTSRPQARSGRRLPFYWWQDNGEASLYAVKPTVARLFREARENTGGNPADSGSGDWSAAEVAAVVDDYLAMLQAEFGDLPYSKAGHRRALLPRLDPVRTAAAVEFKHQNISAAMLDLGLPYIRRYKPMSNCQAALTAEIQRHLEADPQLLRTPKAGTGVGASPVSPLQRTPAPAPSAAAAASPATGSRRGRHLDYGVLQEENRRRGAQGEELVTDYERAWLRLHGRPDLASRVQWTAQDDGDGLGYDVPSFGLDGQERYIELKTTALGAETLFYITSAELDFAQRHIDHYALYRGIRRAGGTPVLRSGRRHHRCPRANPRDLQCTDGRHSSARGVLSGEATEPADGRLAVREEK
jgi:hypothetical protein